MTIKIDEPRKAGASPAVAKGPRRGIAGSPGHDQIAARAKTIWQSKGRPEGKDLENWNEAETQLRKAQ